MQYKLSTIARRAVWSPYVQARDWTGIEHS